MCLHIIATATAAAAAAATTATITTNFAVCFTGRLNILS